MTTQQQIAALRQGKNGFEILNILDQITSTDCVDQVPQVESGYYLTLPTLNELAF